MQFSEGKEAAIAKYGMTYQVVNLPGFDPDVTALFRNDVEEISNQDLDELLDSGPVHIWYTWILVDGGHAKLFFTTEGRREATLFESTMGPVQPQRGHGSHIVYHRPQPNVIRRDAFDVLWQPCRLFSDDFAYPKFYCGHLQATSKRLQFIVLTAVPPFYIKLAHDCLAFAKQTVRLITDYMGRTLTAADTAKLNAITVLTGTQGATEGSFTVGPHPCNPR